MSALGLQKRCSTVNRRTMQHDIWFQHNKNSVSGAALRSLWSSPIQCWQSPRSSLTAVTGSFLPSVVIRPRDERRPYLFFGYSGKMKLRCRKSGDAPSPSKAHVQSLNRRDTSGAQVFENVEKFGHRHLNRAEAKEITPLKAENKHISTSCELHGITKAVDASEKQVVTGIVLKLDTLNVFKVLFRFRFLPVRSLV